MVAWDLMSPHSSITHVVRLHTCGIYVLHAGTMILKESILSGYLSVASCLGFGVDVRGVLLTECFKLEGLGVHWEGLELTEANSGILNCSQTNALALELRPGKRLKKKKREREREREKG